MDLKMKFIEFALKAKALKFGEFTLKSGRISPYFFNAGAFITGLQLSQLGNFYAATINNLNLDYNLIFGPAYKGIPLAATTSISLANQFNTDKLYAFNRKEAKTHGEAGNIVGAPLTGNVLIIDDVITQGGAKREAIEIIKQNGANPVGIVIALDRQEKGNGEISAIEEIKQEFNLPVYSIINFDNLINHLKTSPTQKEDLARCLAYREKYGV